MKGGGVLGASEMAALFSLAYPPSAIYPKHKCRHKMCYPIADTADGPPGLVIFQLAREYHENTLHGTVHRIELFHNDYPQNGGQHDENVPECFLCFHGW